MNDSTASDAAPRNKLRRPRRRTALTLVLATAILLCGMIIGSGLTLHVLWSRLLSNIQDLDNLPARITHRMERPLDLSDQQASEVEAVLNRHFQHIQAIRAEVYPKMSAQLDEIRKEVGAILSPKQREQWDKSFDRLRAKLVPPPPPGNLTALPQSPPKAPSAPDIPASP
jgi:hypothetical protein